METRLGEESKAQNLPVLPYLLNYSDLCIIPHYYNSFNLLKITIGQVLNLGHCPIHLS